MAWQRLLHLSPTSTYALGGADTVNFFIAYDYATQGWLSYFGSSDTGTSADKVLTDDIGIIAGMSSAQTSVRLGGSPLGTNGTSTITLNQGLNLSWGCR